MAPPVYIGRRAGGLVMVGQVRLENFGHDVGHRLPTGAGQAIEWRNELRGDPGPVHASTSVPPEAVEAVDLHPWPRVALRMGGAGAQGWAGALQIGVSVIRRRRSVASRAAACRRSWAVAGRHHEAVAAARYPGPQP